MLAKIIKVFQQADEPLDLKELGRRLGVERSALEGMLELLVRQGKLRQVGLDTETCAHCTGHSSCAQIQLANLTGKTYELVVRPEYRG